MTGFHDDAIQRILNLLGFWRGGGEGLLGFRICSTWKNMISTQHSEDFWEKTWSLIRHILIFFRSPYLDNKLQQVAKILKDSEIFLLSHLGYSQNWLYLIANDRQFSYITNLEKEKENPPMSQLAAFCVRRTAKRGTLESSCKRLQSFKGCVLKSQ